MLKSLWILPVLLLFAAIGASNAQADPMFTYTYTYAPVAGSTFSFTTVALDPAVALGTPEAGIITSSFTGSYSGTVLVAYVLDGSSPLVPGANLLTQVTGGPFLGPPEDFFSPSDYTTAGTYVGACVANCPVSNPVTDTLTVTPVPEPSTSGLMMLGIGLVLVMRKRLAKGLSLAC
jgi:PEP-CTERM motif